MNSLRRDQVAIGLVAAMLVALEIVWTRIFSAEFFYSFAFLVVSLAVLGLGLGALLLRFWPAWATSPRIGTAALLASGTAALGPAAVTRLPIEFVALWHSGGNLALLATGVGLLLLPYLAGGAFCAALLHRHRQNAAQLYAADLVGAAGGGLAAIAAMNAFGVPTATVLCCIPGALAGWGPSRYQRIGTLILLVALVGATFAADTALVPKAPTKAPVIAERWDAMGRIRVYAYNAAERGIDIDGAANMLLYRVRGDWREGLPTNAPEFSLDLRPLIRALAAERVMVVGAGGGSEVMQAKWGGAQRVDAVEVNAGLNDMLIHGRQAAFFGHLYESSGVAVHSTDARVYARQHPAAFDLIISRSSNTFAALSSGAFALAENYLFTTEALADFYRALSADGILLIEHQVYIPRLISALRELGLAAENHLAVYDLPTQRRQVLVLGRQPLARTLVDTTLAALFAAADPASRTLHPVPAAEHLISRIVADGWKAHWSTAAIDISPPTDDRPFVAQMGRWDRLDRGRQRQALAFEFVGFPLARLLVVAVLAVVVAVGVPLLLLPRRWGHTGLSGVAWLYFAAIGMGYMLIEVVWIQQYSLLLGHSAYTFPIVLLALLLSSGAGSFYSQRGGPWLPFVFVAAWTAAHLVLFPHVVAICGGLDWGVRVAISCALIAPPGFLMGMPFPRAARYVGQCIDWGFAVNGVASV
ncbi:MAG: hypothetical protein OXM01_17635, partial [Gemmatimonadota bacterium]|nr:hypothetical protein [Gemmatimonadota bacterium]